MIPFDAESDSHDSHGDLKMNQLNSSLQHETRCNASH